ncbi:MAG TPA: PAAR-like protein [Roseiflexaceae bacterium]|nr:PAAR-like protein [Roseiflexaceae bacterium]
MTIYESEDQKKEKEDIKKAEDTLKKALKSKEYKEASELLKQVYAIVNVEKYLDKLVCGVKAATLIGLIDGLLLATNAFVKSEQLKALGQATGLAHEVSELVGAIQKSAGLSKNIENVVDGGIGVASSVMGILDDYVIQSREFHAVRTASDMAKNISEIKDSIQNISNIIQSGPMVPDGTCLRCTEGEGTVPIKVTHVLPFPIQIIGNNAATIADNKPVINIPLFQSCRVTPNKQCQFKPSAPWIGCNPVELCGKPTINIESQLVCIFGGIITPICTQNSVSSGMLLKEAVGVLKNSNELLKNSVELSSTIEGEDEKEKGKDKTKDKQQGSK